MIVDTNIGTNHEPAKVEVLHMCRTPGRTGTGMTYQTLVKVLEPARFAGDYVLSSPCGNWAYAYHNNPRRPADCFCIGIGWWEMQALYAKLPQERISEQTLRGLVVADGILAYSG